MFNYFFLLSHTAFVVVVVFLFPLYYTQLVIENKNKKVYDDSSSR